MRKKTFGTNSRKKMWKFFFFRQKLKMKIHQLFFVYGYISTESFEPMDDDHDGWNHHPQVFDSITFTVQWHVVKKKLFHRNIWLHNLHSSFTRLLFIAMIIFFCISIRFFEPIYSILAAAGRFLSRCFWISTIKSFSQ